MPTINAIGTPQITLGGTFTMSGAYTFIGQLTGNTNVTFPTSGTLATTGGTVQSIQGTANQVLVNGTSGSPVTGGAITLTTPQDIATTSSPTFLALTVGNLNLSSNSIISTNTNGNINAIPNGTGTTVIGSATALTPVSGTVNNLQVIGKPTLNAGFALAMYRNAAAAPMMQVYKSRSTTIGSFVPVTTNDFLGQYSFYGDDGTQFTLGASIQCLVTGAVSLGIVPSSLVFRTNSTVGAIATAMTISSEQIVSLANALLPVSGGLGTSTAPSAGQIPIGNSSGTYTPAAINSGTNITVANGSASITVNLSGIVAPTLGGTGINNGSNTLTLSGTLATSGAFSSVFTMTGSTNVTFPTTGTLATTAGTAASIQGTANQVFANGTSGSSVTGAVTLTTPQDIGTASTPTFGGLTLSSGADTAENIVSTSATGMPYVQWTRNTSTAINYIQAGTNVLGNASSTGTLFVNNIAGGDFFFNVTGTGNLLTLGIAAATFTKNIGTLSGTVTVGSTAGQADSSVYLFSPTANLGTLIVRAANNAGANNNILTNASTSTPRTWTLPDASGTVLVTGSAINSVPSITFSSTSGIIGTTTNDSAASGSVGQEVESVILAASAISLSSTVSTNITSISLGAGDWDVWGNIVFSSGAATVVVAANANISPASATLLDIAYRWVTTTFAASSVIGSPVPGYRVSLASPSSVFLCVNATFSVDTFSAYGGLYARRRR